MSDQPQPLFTAAQLGDWLGTAVDSANAAVVERVVWGWLRPVLGYPEARPNPVPDELFSDALELGAIAHRNPSGLASKSRSDVTEVFTAGRGGNARERRDAILETVAARVRGDVSIGPVPRALFPDAEPYPDPNRTARSDTWWETPWGMRQC